MTGFGLELDADGARDVVMQPLCPRWPEMWIVLPPDEQRRVIEPTQTREQIERHACVRRIELSG
jgi:hypothetical protein